MKRSISTALMALGALVLIFCIAFTVVQAVGSDYGFFEEEFIKLGLDSSMNMTIGDISKGLQALMEYMNGRVDTIDVDIMLNGELTPMYVLDIEHIHMEEVREVWLGFETARNLGFLIAALLVLGAVMVDNKTPLRNGATGYLWALGTALVVCLFLGVWAGTNFNSFWTQFHKIIFPNSDNWLLPSSSRMIQMLPGELFQDVVMRCGLIIILILVGLGVGAVMALVLPKKKLEKAQTDTNPNASNTQKEQTVGTLQQETPDLVLMHKLLNMSVTRRREVEAELALKKQQEAEKREAEKTENEEQNNPENARVKIEFAAYEGDTPDASEIDEEEKAEAEWIAELTQRRKKKTKKANGKKSSGKKKKTGTKKASEKVPEKANAKEETEKKPLTEEAVQEIPADITEEAVQEEPSVDMKDMSAPVTEGGAYVGRTDHCLGDNGALPEERTEKEHEKL